jgi:hypothetical protein
LVYAGFAAVLGYFASAPSYQHFPRDMAQIKLSFAHGGERVGECRRLTPEELAKLAPNMRKPVVCPRERVPVFVELELDEEILYRDSLSPPGLFGDGPSRAYQRFAVAPGPHRLTARMRDSGRSEGFDYEREADVDLIPGQNFSIDLRAETEGFIFR